MKKFFNEYGGVTIIVIVIAVLLLIVGSVKSLDENSGKVEGSGIAKAVGNNLSDTMDTFQKQLVPNENLAILEKSNLSDEYYNGMQIHDSKYEEKNDGINVDLGGGSIKKVKPNTYYTLSFYARGFGSTYIGSYFFPDVIESGYSSQGDTTTIADGRMYPKLTTEWKKITLTWKTKANVNGTAHFIAARRNKAGPRIQIAGVKLEEGKKATPFQN